MMDRPRLARKSGHKAYESCTRCDWTTYKKIPALKHNYQQKEVVEPTCKSGGYTLYACTRCSDTCTKNPTDKLLHWYGEWTADGCGAHSAICRRDDCGHNGKADCQMVDFQMDGETMRFCPVCGELENGERLEWIEDASADAVTEALPQGEVIARSNGAFLSLAFEYAGKCTVPTGKVRFTLPAERFDGAKLTLVMQDGTQTELPSEEIDGAISFELDFTDAELPVMLIRF